MLLINDPLIANSNEDMGLGVEEHVEIVVQLEIPRPVNERERLEQMASRGEIRTLVMETTAYTHTGDATASGVMPYVGGIAVDPKVIPLGSEVYVEGYGLATAIDTGGAIKGHIIDLFMESESSCIAYGRQMKKVYIISVGKYNG